MLLDFVDFYDPITHPHQFASELFYRALTAHTRLTCLYVKVSPWASREKAIVNRDWKKKNSDDLFFRVLN